MNSTELAVYTRMPDPLAFVREFGTEIALSKMFGCANESQGKVLAMACLCEGENPIALSRKYHIIENNLSMKADWMLAELRERGGKHKIVTRTADEACVEIVYDGQTYQERFTWAEAQLEPYVYKADGKSFKKNWATPRARRQMLWARVISEAVRTIAPEIVAGTYTPEEAMDFAEEPPVAASKVVDVEQLMQQTAAKAEPVDDVVDVEAKPVEEKAAEKCTAEQRKQIKSMFDVLSVNDEQISKAMEKRGVKAIRYLTSVQADELIDTLTAKAQAAATVITGESSQPEDATEARKNAPCGSVIVDEIKSLLKDNLDLMKRVKEHLVTNGLSKIADLSHDQAIALKNSLETDTIDIFFAQSLVPFDPGDSPSG